MQTITLQDVVTAGRKAYDEKRLSAQGPTPTCAYRDKSCLPCVIGAAMTDETVKLIKEKGWHNSTISQLINRQLVDVPPAEVMALVKIQDAHDKWAKALETGFSGETEEQFFVETLDAFTPKA